MEHIHWLGSPTDIADAVLSELAEALLNRGQARAAALVAGVEAIRFHWPAGSIPATSTDVELFCDGFLHDAFDQRTKRQVTNALAALLLRRGIRLGTLALNTTPGVPPLDATGQ